jgi:hypothetical protein
MEEVTIPKDEYLRLKMQAKMANVDTELLIQIIQSLREIKEGKVRRVK